jgi:hypothetical protein
VALELVLLLLDFRVEGAFIRSVLVAGLLCALDVLLAPFYESIDAAPYMSVFPTCAEIKILRRVRAESSRRSPRHRRDACSTAWRCRFLTARPSQHGRVIAEK